MKRGGHVPTYVYVVLGSVFLFGVWRILAAIFTFREARRPPDPAVWAPKLQVTAWACLLVGAVLMFATGHGVIGIFMLVVGVMLPVTKTKKRPKGSEDWPNEQPSAASPTLRCHANPEPATYTSDQKVAGSSPA